MKQQAFLVDRNEVLRKDILDRERTRKESGRKGSTGRRSSTKKKSQSKVYDCEVCGLDKKSSSPKMEAFGEGRKGILFIGTSPGREEDRANIPIAGQSSKLLKQILSYMDIDLFRDCYLTNIVRCMVSRRDEPSKEEMLCCRSRVFADIENLNPKLVICLGDKATEVILGPLKLKSCKLNTTHGLLFPYQEYNCWVGATYHPAVLLKERSKKYMNSKEHIFTYDLCDMIAGKDKPVPQVLNKDNCILLSKSNDCLSVLDEIIEQNIPTAFDYETTCISPYDESAKVLTVAVANNVDKGYCIPLNMNNWNEFESAFVWKKFIEFLVSGVPKVVQNFNMEELWGRVHFKQRMNNFLRDTLSTHHAIYCRRGTANLDFQVKLLTGDMYKKESVDTKSLESEPVEQVSTYNGLDARYTLMSHFKQETLLTKDLSMFDSLLKNSLITLANMKERGINFDTKLLGEFNTTYSAKVLECKDAIDSCEVVREFEEKEDKHFNMNSGPQVAQVLFDYFGLDPIKKTKGGKCSTDAATLVMLAEKSKNKEAVKFIHMLQDYSKYDSFVKKIVSYGKFVSVDGKMHPSFHLDVAETYRSSSSDPNVHNMPKHDDLLKQLRRCVVPSSGNILMEGDLDGQEVRVIAMYSGDPVLTKQIQDDFDTHRLWASRIYEMDPDKITKEQRYYGKNKFVFPSFYGAQPASIARALKKDVKFIESVQSQFWIEYVEVKRWQESMIKVYEETGCVYGLSGFRRSGPLSIEQILNTPVQGLAFHLLLDALVKIDTALIRKKLKTVIINQVHDSIVFDGPEEEAEEVIELSTRIMTSKRFEWQRDVPLSVTWEVGNNWLDMEEI